MAFPDSNIVSKFGEKVGIIDLDSTTPKTEIHELKKTKGFNDIYQTMALGTAEELPIIEDTVVKKQSNNAKAIAIHEDSISKIKSRIEELKSHIKDIRARLNSAYDISEDLITTWIDKNIVDTRWSRKRKRSYIKDTINNVSKEDILNFANYLLKYLNNSDYTASIDMRGNKIIVTSKSKEHLKNNFTDTITFTYRNSKVIIFFIYFFYIFY